MAPEASEPATETSEMAPETPEATLDPAPEGERIEPHPDLLIGGEPSVPEESGEETPNSEDENNSEG